MWVLRALNGPNTGQIIPLKQGQNIIGRSARCDIIVQSVGVSKEHAQIDVIGDKIIVSDLQSRNGTLVNGTKIQRHRLEPGDKLAIYDIIFDVALASEVARQQHMAHLGTMNSLGGEGQNLQPDQNQNWENQGSSNPYMAPDPIGAYNNTSLSQDSNSENRIEPPPAAALLRQNSIYAYIHHYIENVAMPAIYRLTEMAEFRLVLAAFIGIVIILTSTISTIIMVQVSRDSVVSEAKRRTATLASMLQESNRAAVASGRESALDTTRVGKEEGVTEAIIVAPDGQIMAPASKIGTYSKSTFIAQAIRSDRAINDRIDTGTVGASAPIYFYDQNLGRQTVRAYAVVIYELDALAADDGQFIILFVKTLLLALLVGVVFWYFIVRLIEHPIEKINHQLDKALRDGQGQTDTLVQMTQLKILVNNINSALSRTSGSAFNDDSPAIFSDRDSESQNLVQLIGLPAMVIDGHEETVKFMNRPFEEITGLSFANLQRQSIEAITDQSLRLSVQSLIANAHQQPHLIASDTLDFSGENYDLCVQAVHGEKQIAYYIVLLQPPLTEQVHEAGGF